MASKKGSKGAFGGSERERAIYYGLYKILQEEHGADILLPVKVLDQFFLGEITPKELWEGVYLKNKVLGKKKAREVMLSVIVRWLEEYKKEIRLVGRREWWSADYIDGAKEEEKD